MSCYFNCIILIILYCDGVIEWPYTGWSSHYFMATIWGHHGVTSFMSHCENPHRGIVLKVLNDNCQTRLNAHYTGKGILLSIQIYTIVICNIYLLLQLPEYLICLAYYNKYCRSVEHQVIRVGLF